jgi:hypothetical protein
MKIYMGKTPCASSPVLGLQRVCNGVGCWCRVSYKTDMYTHLFNNYLSYQRHRKKYTCKPSPIFISFALPFLLSPAALARRAAAISASEDSPTRHQSPTHINAQIEDDRRRLRRWLMRIRPRLKDRLTSTAVAE